MKIENLVVFGSFEIFIWYFFKINNNNNNVAI